MGSRANVTLLACVAALVALVSLPPAAPAAATQARELRWTPLELAFLQRINDYRAANGGRRLVFDQAIGRVARRHACDMRTARALSHQSTRILRQRLVRWRQYGENVGTGDSLPQLWRAFLRSAPHRRNIVANWGAPGYVGVAARRDADGMLWVTMSFTRGDPQTTVAPALDRC